MPTARCVLSRRGGNRLTSPAIPEFTPANIERNELAAGFQNPTDGRAVIIKVLARRPRATNVTVICVGSDW